MSKHKSNTSSASPIVLAQSFNRSTNLELDYQDPSRLHQIYVSQKFEDCAFEIFNSVEESNSNQRVRVLSGSPGLGKTTFALFMSHCLFGQELKSISSLIESSESKNKSIWSEHFKKINKSRLLPVFINGFMGEIEDVFLSKLREAFARIGQTDAYNNILKQAAKNQYDIVRKWQKSFPHSYELYLTYLSSEGLDAVDFEKQLKRGTSKARELFEHIYPQVTGGASASESGTDTIAIYRLAIDHLTENTPYKGLFVVYDEFGKYLEKGIHSPSSLNIQFLQDFAEFCDRSGKQQCHLTLITHMSVSQYAGQLPINIQKEWAKIEGRFQETSFYDKGANYFKMMSHVFDQSIEITQPSLHKEVLKNSKHFILSIKGLCFDDLVNAPGASDILATMYPLHPAVIALLPFLSAKVAQNERTLYTFLTRDEDSSLKKFIDQITNWNKPTYLNLSALYQYFAPLIAKDSGVGGTYRIGLVAEEAFNKIPTTEAVAREVISYIALANVLKNNRYASTTKEVIQAVIGDTKAADKALSDLMDQRILFFNKIQKQYELHQGSSIDIQEEIERLKGNRLTSKDLVKIIKHYYPQDFFIPKRYNFKHSITRFLRTEMISVQELKVMNNELRPDYHKEDGILYFVIPFDRDELDQARHLSSKLLAELSIIVLPKTFIECRHDIEELNSLNNLYSNKEIVNSGPLVKKELDKHKNILISSIRSIMDKLMGSFSLEAEVFYPRLKIRRAVSAHVELQRNLSEILEKEYSSYVHFNSELINKHKLAGAVSLSRKELIEAMIAHPDKKYFGLEGNGAEVSIAKVLSNVSAAKWNKETSLFNLKNKALTNIRDFYREQVGGSGQGQMFEQLQEKLIAPPFGLRKGLIPLYIALFDKTLEHPVNHFLDGVFVAHPDGIHYDLLAKQPKQCRIKYTEIDPVRFKYLNFLMQEFEVEGDPSVNILITEILKWRKKIPDFTKSVEQIDIRAKKLLIAIDSATEPDKLIFDRIPESLDLKLDKSTIDLIIADLSKVKKMAVAVYPNLINRLQSHILEFLHFIQRDCLNTSTTKYQKGMNMAELLEHNWSKLNPEVRNYPFSKTTNSFLQRFIAFDSKNHQQYLIENMADALTGVNPRHWDFKHESMFEMALSQVQSEIESVCEYLGSAFNGESVIAFISREDERKEFIRLGVLGVLPGDHLTIRKEIESSLNGLGHRERNQLLLSLIIKENSTNLNQQSEQMGLNLQGQL